MPTPPAAWPRPRQGCTSPTNCWTTIRGLGVTHGLGNAARRTGHLPPRSWGRHRREHKIHTEWYELPEDTAGRLNAARRENRRIIAVGTTTVRTLEQVAQDASQNGVREISATTGDADLFILPRPPIPLVVDAMLTNFHLPRSTLLMLVSAFAGRERILAAYEEAVRAGIPLSIPLAMRCCYSDAGPRPKAKMSATGQVKPGSTGSQVRVSLTPKRRTVPSSLWATISCVPMYATRTSLTPASSHIRVLASTTAAR